MVINIPDDEFTTLFIERYSERVAIMSIDGWIKNPEESAYADTVEALQREISRGVERIPSLELCKTAK